MTYIFSARTRYTTGSAIQIPQGSSFPSSGNQEGDLFWRVDESVLYVYDSSQASWIRVDPGGKYEEYVHEQELSTATWEVPHDLNTIELFVTVYDNQNPQNIVSPNSVEIVDSNNIKINFASAQLGTAIVSGVPDVGSSPETSSTASRGGNHIVNFPMITDQDLAQPEWWEVENANVTLTYDQDLLGNESVPDDIFPEGFKVVAGASGADVVVGQRILLSSHDLLHEGDTVSASVWVYQPTVGNVLKFELYADDNEGSAFGAGGGTGSGSLRTTTTTVSDQWTKLSIQGAVIGSGDTYVEFRLSTEDASDTFYFTAPMFNLGKYARPWEVNPLVYHDNRETGAIVSISTASVDTWSSMDYSSYAHPLACKLDLRVAFSNSGTGYKAIRIKPGYSSAAAAGGSENVATTIPTNAWQRYYAVPMPCDSGQVIESAVSNTAITNPNANLRGYWRWLY